MKLEIDAEGRVWLNDHEIESVSSVDIKNINPIERIDVVLNIQVDEINIDNYKIIPTQHKEVKQMNTTKEQHELLIKSLVRFVERVAEDKKATPAELAALPEIVKLLLN